MAGDTHSGEMSSDGGSGGVVTSSSVRLISLRPLLVDGAASLGTDSSEVDGDGISSTMDRLRVLESLDTRRTNDLRRPSGNN